MSVPTCPWCGHHDRAITVGHPGGRYYCACGSLFTGGDNEWRRLAQYRREAIERNIEWSTKHGTPGATDYVYESALHPAPDDALPEAS